MAMSARGPRKFAPKAKTGCQTCRSALISSSTHRSRLIRLYRIRRIKCGEQRPACRRCLSTSRNCDGYDYHPVVSSPNRPLTQNLGNAQEHRSFEFFRTSTSSRFSGDFGSSFWSRIVLQACYMNTSLRHAAIAIGSLHEDFMMGRKTDVQQSMHEGAGFTLLQYTKALEGTRKALEANDQPLIVTLMACILFFCFESLRGQLVYAVIHLRNGLNILRLSYLEINSSSAASKTVINDDILCIFARLGFQANYFVDQTHPINQTQLIQQLQNLSPNRSKRISTLEEAQASLYACLNGTMFSDHVKTPMADANSFTSEYHMTRCAQLILSRERPAEFYKGREKAINALEEWNISFKDFLLAQQAFMTSKDIKASTLLKIHHLVARLMLTTACCPPLEKFDFESAILQFKQILEWSKVLLCTDHQTMTTTMSEFSPDVGIIAPIFFVATNCPDPILRSEAKSILASEHRREGIWDTDVATKIIEDLNI